MAGTPFWEAQFMGIPVWVFIIVGLVCGVVYLLISRKSKPKEFKELDLKKETKKRFKREYSYFGEHVGKTIFDVKLADEDKPNKVAFAIGLMKVVWNEQYKRYEPLFRNFDKAKMWEKMSLASKQIYQKEFKDLDDNQKKNIAELAREELRDEQVETLKVGDKSKIVRGKREVFISKPVPMLCFKVCSTSMISKFLAVMLGIGTHYFLFDADQVSIEADGVFLLAHFQRKIFQDQFVFSKAGKDYLQDISFVVDREQQLQAIANETSKVTFFDTGLGAQIEKTREAYKLEAEKHKAQSEGHEMG